MLYAFRSYNRNYSCSIVQIVVIISHVGGAAVDAARAEFFAHHHTDSTDAITVGVAGTTEYLACATMVTRVTQARTRRQAVAVSIA